MPSIPKPQNKQDQDKMSEAYSLFFKLFMEKFFRSSGIWFQYFTDREGKSLYQKFGGDNPQKALEELTGGKTDLLGRIVLEKFEAALILWAIEKMGDDVEKYVGRGLEMFFTGVMLKVLGVGTYNRDGFTERPKRSFLDAIRETPLSFPVQLRKEPGFPFEKHQELKQEYEAILSRVSKLKRKRWNNEAAYTLALIEALPGTPRKKAESYRSKKPSDVALDYLGRKYKLLLGVESIKKYVHLKRIPQDLFDMELKRIAPLAKKRRLTAPVKPLQ